MWYNQCKKELIIIKEALKYLKILESVDMKRQSKVMDNANQLRGYRILRKRT